jgi:thiol-disulfide isomerase/thioredoxin
MRRILAGLVGLALLAPACADDTKKADKAEAPKSPKGQVTATTDAFQKEMGDLFKQFQTAKTQEEKVKIRDKAMKELVPGVVKKLMAIAADNPKDPAAVDALMFVCTNQFTAGTPQAGDALKALLKEHADSPKLGDVCKMLAQRPDGDKLIRDVHAKATNPAAKLVAGFCLAEALQEKDDATPADTKEAEKLLEEVVAKAKTIKDAPPDLAKEAEAILNLFVGRAAPAAESKDLDDKAVTLADLKGKVVVLDFWATWCPPCRGMIPHERELVKKHAGKPFAFVSVSADNAKDDLTKFLNDQPMPWTHWYAGRGGSILKAWRIQAFPTIYVIDAKGVIRGKIVGGGPDNEKKIDELVEKLVNEADGKSTQ